MEALQALAVSAWSVDHVESWMKLNGHEAVCDKMREDEIDGEVLRLFATQDYQDYGLAKGPAMKLAKKLGTMFSPPPEPHGDDVMPETAEAVREWITRCGYSELGAKLEEEEIDGEALSLLELADFVEYGVPRGPARKLIHRIKAMQARAAGGAEEVAAVGGAAATGDDSAAPGNAGQAVPTEIPAQTPPAQAVPADIPNQEKLAQQMKQMEVRERLHQAVENRDADGVRAVLDAEGSLLLASEARWAERELKSILAEDSERNAREETTAALKEASDCLDLERAIARAEEIALPAEDISDAKLRLQVLNQKELNREVEERACMELDKAVRDESAPAIFAVLALHEAHLPPEKVAKVQRKVPAIIARTEVRKELANALRNGGDIDQLRHAIYTAKLTTLPREEIAAAEEAFREKLLVKRSLESKASAQSGECQMWEVVGGGSKGGIIVRTGRSLQSDQKPQLLSTGSIAQEIELLGERLHYQLRSGVGPQTGWVSTKVPGRDLVVRTDKAPGGVSPLERAIRDNDKQGIRDAMRDLAAKGLSAQAIKDIFNQATEAAQQPLKEPAPALEALTDVETSEPASPVQSGTDFLGPEDEEAAIEDAIELLGSAVESNDKEGIQSAVQQLTALGLTAHRISELFNQASCRSME
mmetsp:Transcript_118958/g.337264  ORF Transcript_118958/g.337264 Transcript_118958/m.337264 type:complete len:647 (-) Transcript_118958:28-1968(-)